MTQPITPAVWVDGDPLMEAIAAAVWEHCNTEPTSSVVDDPRNIAAVAAAVTRQIISATEQQPAAAEAYPTEISWLAEVQESDDQWMYLCADYDRAVVERRIASVQKRFPRWKDGTPVNGRVIRKTTTYTVEPATYTVEQPVALCDVMFEDGRQCAKPEGHRPAGSHDAHVPATAIPAATEVTPR